MKIFRFSLGLVLICLFVTGVSQNNNAPIIEEGDIPGAKILNQSEYGGKSLWGYINGGADLYLEYGFSKLFVQEIVWNNVLLKANIYQMESKEAAFGIFSVNVHKCKNRNVIKPFDCQGPYQYQAFKGKYYISIINESGKSEAEKVSKELAEILLNKIITDELDYPPLFLREPFKDHLGKLKFMNGKLGLQNGYPDWGDYFKGLKDYQLWLLPMEDVVIAFIDFGNDEDADLFLNQIRADSGDKIKSWEINDKKLILFKSSPNNVDSDKYLKVVEGYIN